MTHTDIFATNNPFRVAMTAAQAAEIADHWAKVRAGLHTPADRVFDQDIAGQIAVRSERINRLFAAAAKEAREIEALHAMDVQQ